MEEFENLQETKLSSQPIFDGDVLHIYKDTVRLPNGKTSTREYTVHHGAVCILPLLENGDVLLERAVPLRHARSPDGDPRREA